VSPSFQEASSAWTIARLIPKTRELKGFSLPKEAVAESDYSKVNPENKGTESGDLADELVLFS